MVAWKDFIGAKELGREKLISIIDQVIDKYKNTLSSIFKNKIDIIKEDVDVNDREYYGITTFYITKILRRLEFEININTYNFLNEKELSSDRLDESAFEKRVNETFIHESRHIAQKLYLLETLGYKKFKQFIDWEANLDYDIQPSEVDAQNFARFGKLENIKNGIKELYSPYIYFLFDKTC